MGGNWPLGQDAEYISKYTIKFHKEDKMTRGTILSSNGKRQMRLTVTTAFLLLLLLAPFSIAGAEIDALVSAGGAHNCGMRANGTVACWGLNNFGQSTPPAGTFTQVKVGSWHNCGVRANGTVACWGKNDFGQSTPPAGTFMEVSAGSAHTCGVRANGTIACWGDNYDGQSTPPAGTFTEVSAGG